ncbi:hypothetical protein [Streptantibioticus cattleyicolor]|uniref:Uncharacterized protein n=1 Tax=Streptantibioticus cattleyicolor (strain ATCC 35852 / DSM 46488 / JCM 4925 / NBRC 14057 / NRRL 8057) TaxID=1003195 RepID=F8JJ94_STREN|nr:hypothetical protein [Streptantibioticus cattleyicolor]AEW98797.1 hypothetical protein SCATT_p06040 [Streptantibioticus cattleyicolor NRRL 8057 = DSM 46488]CCB72153.1 protein of unknown function [Streptantibioticus cattleyicolor NRRL 8057 = DSM 46488]
MINALAAFVIGHTLDPARLPLSAEVVAARAGVGSEAGSSRTVDIVLDGCRTAP